MASRRFLLGLCYQFIFTLHCSLVVSQTTSATSVVESVPLQTTFPSPAHSVLDSEKNSTSDVPQSASVNITADSEVVDEHASDELKLFPVTSTTEIKTSSTPSSTTSTSTTTEPTTTFPTTTTSATTPTTTTQSTTSTTTTTTTVTTTTTTVTTTTTTTTTELPTTTTTGAPPTKTTDLGSPTTAEERFTTEALGQSSGNMSVGEKETIQEGSPLPILAWLIPLVVAVTVLVVILVIARVLRSKQKKGNYKFSYNSRPGQDPGLEMSHIRP